MKLTEEELAKLPPLTIDSTLRALSVHLNCRVNIRAAAKEVGINEKKLSSILKENGYIYQQGMWYIQNSSYEDVEDIKNRTISEALNPMVANEMKEVSMRDRVNKTRINRVNRQVPVDKDTIEVFLDFCDRKELFVSQAFTLALKEFMEKYDK